MYDLHPDSHNAIVADHPVVTPGHLATEALTLHHHAIVVPTPLAPVLVLAIILPLQGADTAPGMQLIGTLATICCTIY